MFLLDLKIKIMYKQLIDQSKLIKLEEETHTYKLQESDIKFQSVTEFIHTFFKPFVELFYEGLGPPDSVRIHDLQRPFPRRGAFR